MTRATTAAFELTATNNATGDVVTQITETDVNGGTYIIDLSQAYIPDDFCTIYDVSVKAKNNAENDWSRNSFTLYIYDKTALDILVQPVIRDNVTTVGVDGDSVTMSNTAWIDSLSQAQILALNRDIDLQTVISINYGAHAWGELSDLILWSSDDSNTTAVNYPQGAYYENIENLTYPSYAPATEFLLSGKNDGETVVTAIHSLAGNALSSSVTVDVNTLKDKLYLFQFYPDKEVKLTYTNGNRDIIEDYPSAADGRAAVYEEIGIASDVYVKAVIGR